MHSSPILSKHENIYSVKSFGKLFSTLIWINVFLKYIYIYIFFEEWLQFDSSFTLFPHSVGYPEANDILVLLWGQDENFN